MREKFSKLLQSFFTHKNLFAIFFLALFVFLLVPENAHAGLGSTIGNAIANAAALVVGKILGFFSSVLALIFGVVSVALMAVINFFMGMTVTPGAEKTPLFVSDTWNIVRQLVNMFFILILTFIGLATILRLSTYQVKQTFPLLIVIALLVNFSGIFVGFIVDITNLVSNFFLSAAAEVNWSSLKELWKSGINDNPFALAAKQIAQILYFLVAILIYFVLMFVFMIRTVFLWVIVILSPIAFASYVLPATRGKIWGPWFEQLIQWSLFVIPVSLTLWLAGEALTIPKNWATSPSEASNIAEFLAPFTALLILYIGVTQSQQMAPAAARAVADWAQKTGLGMGKGMASGAWRKIEGAKMKDGGGRISNFGAGIKKWGNKGLESIQSDRAKKQKELDALKADKTWSKEKGATMDALQAEITALDAQEATTTGAPWYRRKRHFTTGLAGRWVGGAIELAGKEATMRMLDQDVQEQEAAANEVAGRDSYAAFNLYNQERAKGPLANKNRMVGLLNGIRNRGDGDDIDEAIESGVLKGSDIGLGIKTGLRGGPPQFRPLLKSFYGQIMMHPERYGFNATSKENADGTLTFTGKDAEFLQGQYKSIPTKFTAQDFQGDTLSPKNFDMDTEEGQFFARTMTKSRGAEFMSSIGRRPRKEESRKFLEYIFKEGEYEDNGLGVDWLLDNNAEDVLRYLDSPGARSLGLGRGISREEIEAIIDQKQNGKTKGDALEQQALLEQEETTLKASGAKDNGKQLTRVRSRLIQVHADLELMDIKDSDLNKQIEELRTTVQATTTDISNNENDLKARQERAKANSALKPLENELRRRGPAQTVSQVTQDITEEGTKLQETKAQLNTREQALGIRIKEEQGKAIQELDTQKQALGIRIKEAQDQAVQALNAREQELGNLIKEAQEGQGESLDSSYQQALPAWEIELAAIPAQRTKVQTGEDSQVLKITTPLQSAIENISIRQSQIEKNPQILNVVKQIQAELESIPNERVNIERDIRATAIKLGQAQLNSLQNPQAPLPLPTSRKDMPNPLRGAISNARKIVQTIQKHTTKMEQSIQLASDTYQDYNKVLAETKNITAEIANINAQSKADGTLNPQLRSKRSQLQSKLPDLDVRNRELEDEIQKQTEIITKRKEAIDSSRENLQRAREVIDPLLQNYGGVKEKEGIVAQNEQRARNRKKQK